ncbi:hypothetical protein [Rhizohabitans arisaemae]|uniref:hypothetical protein n=1 Tax=Rhizohabitans arisaemae TaxID=2720610 RepID=UPI0024B211D3|nr:hypothetical protein [Rhizohabitans arisaemae]
MRSAMPIAVKLAGGLLAATAALAALAPTASAAPVSNLPTNEAECLAAGGHTNLLFVTHAPLRVFRTCHLSIGSFLIVN